jgi:LmbE family N-acetylglucosaminyl deacetylase/SAM-dependent methyltransferase
MDEARAFTHRDTGTDEPTWLLDPGWDSVPRLDLAAIIERCPRIVVVAPHPDDETLSLGATLSDLSAQNVDVTVVFATHGGNGPESTSRRTEGDRATAALGAGIAVLWWDLPDGGLDAARGELCRRLAELIDERTVVFAPVECDGHSDHDAAARAAEEAVRQQSAVLINYPVWLWHWATPADMDWSRVRTLAPSLRGLDAKKSAIDCYPSQMHSDDGPAIVGSSVLSRAHRVFETVLIPAAADLAERICAAVDGGRARDAIAEPFDAMMASGEEDPWHLDDFVYERRRLELVLACLGRERYQRILEIGCATGQLAEQLTDRADTVVAIDASERALAVARSRTQAVRWICGAAPADLPDETFDAIILSEVGYFMDGPDLIATLRTVRRHLSARGEIVLAHWRGPTAGIPLDGAAVHAQAASLLDLPLRARYEDVDLVVEVWGEPVSVYREYRGAS